MRRSVIDYIESKQMRKDAAEFRTGDTVRVHWKVKEGDKERVQPFEGIVIRKTRGHNRATFTVRKISYGVGVERIFPLHSPRYEKIEVLSHGDVHRNRLFFLRNLKGKASRVETHEEQGTEAHAPRAEPAPAPQTAVGASPADSEEKPDQPEQPSASEKKVSAKKARAAATAEK